MGILALTNKNMAKFCPILKSPVVYLTCLECEDKACEKTTDGESNTKTKESDLKSLSNIDRYELTLCEGECDEEIVYALITDDMAKTIAEDINGKLNCECLITLEDGRVIETGIIDRIKKIQGEQK